jgi:TusA-related sulfurtransferase
LFTLHGPTNFAPLLQQAQAIAKARSGEYLVVLIITDGTISDVDNTIEAIVDCARCR